MDKKVKARWVKALLSGRYKQAREILQDENGANCCLGVLCRIARLHRESCADGCWYFYWKDLDTKERGMLPTDFRKYVGISPEVQNTLTKMNDDNQSTFKDIAKWIKKNL